MKKQFPSADYLFSYDKSPVSGNVINGLNSSETVRAKQIFHGSGARTLEWRAFETLFVMLMPFRIFWQGIVNLWMLRQADGPVAKTQVEDDPQHAAKKLKQKALELGAGVVGVCEMTELGMFEHYTPTYKYAVVVVVPKDYEEMKHVTQYRGGLETMRVYMEISKVVISLGKYIRKQGWSARAFGESADILHLPLAIQAGLGELGKHGSLITREFGSNVRLATVLTNMPLAVDGPVDIGVEDLCLGCRRCTIDCPADAISDTKQLVRGIEKWYVDFDKCVPYFVKTIGCGICIQVCPWSKPGRGAALSQKLLEKRNRTIAK